MVGSAAATVVEQQAAILPNSTKNERGAWVQIDLGRHRRLIPTRSAMNTPYELITLIYLLRTTPTNFYFLP